MSGRLALAAMVSVLACDSAPRRSEPQVASPNLATTANAEAVDYDLPTDGVPTLVVDGNVFRYNGHVLRMLDRLETWEGVLGKPSRVRKEDWVIGDTWDDLGLRLGAKPTPDGRAYVRVVDVEFIAIDDPGLPQDSTGRRAPESPRGAFPGRVVVEQAVLRHGWNDVATFSREIRGVPPFDHCNEAHIAAFAVAVPDVPKLLIWINEQPTPDGGRCARRFCELEFSLERDWWW
jgi:hypothetical protein